MRGETDGREHEKAPAEGGKGKEQDVQQTKSPPEAGNAEISADREGVHWNIPGFPADRRTKN